MLLLLLIVGTVISLLLLEKRNKHLAEENWKRGNVY